MTGTLDDDVHALFARRSAVWEGRLRLLPDGALSRRSAIAALPELVAELYPPIPRERLVRAAFALCAFSDAIVACDDVIDYAAHDPAATRRLPEIAVIFAEAYGTFAELFGGEPRFWEPLRRYFVDYVDALAAEARIAAEPGAWADCDEAACLTIVRGKNGLVRLVDAAIAALAGCPQRPGADEMLLEWFAGEQMVDDLNDWREDVRDGNVSLLLRSASAQRPQPDALEEVGRALYGGGHADRALALAEELLDRARAAAERDGGTRLAATLAARRQRITALRERIAQALEAAR